MSIEQLANIIDDNGMKKLNHFLELATDSEMRVMLKRTLNLTKLAPIVSNRVEANLDNNLKDLEPYLRGVNASSHRLIASRGVNASFT